MLETRELVASCEGVPEKLVRRYRHVVNGLVRKHLPSPRVNAWVSEDDYRSEAWEAVCRVAQRCPDLQDLDLENVLVASAQNAIRNMKRRMDRSNWLQGKYLLDERSRAAGTDPFAASDAAIWIDQLGEQLRPPVRSLLRAVLLAVQLGAWRGRRIPVVLLAHLTGRCTDTIRSHQLELRRIARRLAIETTGATTLSRRACDE